MARANSKSTRNRPKNRRGLILGIAVLIAVTVACTSASISGMLWVWDAIVGSDDPQETVATTTWAADSADLTVAVSPVMAPVFQELANQFNSRDNRTPDGKRMSVAALTLAPERMIIDALNAPPFQAISPDSSLWLDQLEQEWAVNAEPTDSPIPIGQSRISDPTRYAVSPVVIAAWEPVARELGWPDQPVGWQTIQAKAIQDDAFRWNHASTNTASGLLATLAEFYAGAGLTRGLTEEAATDPATIEYVQAVESTISFYGEGEEVIVQRLADEGRNFLDAFVAQERVVLNWNRQTPNNRLVAIYPAEGTLWTDHPIALLELGARVDETPVTDNQRLTFRAFTQFLLGAEAQMHLLASGYRPADLSIQLDADGSPFANTDAVDWRQPQTTLQMPPPSVVNVVRNVWSYTKRPTNVYLVVDTSGSMSGEKMVRTREALATYVEQIEGERDRVGIIEFGGGVKNFTPLRVMDEPNRRDTLNVIEAMEPFGGTALIDAAYLAIEDLQQLNDTEAINAVVVMTDGIENSSYYSMNDFRRMVNEHRGVPVVVFTIGFGRDVDERMLTEMAQIGGGQYRFAEEADIEELYRIISTYF